MSLAPSRRSETRLTVAAQLRYDRHCKQDRQNLSQMTATAGAVQDAIILLDDTDAVASWSGGARDMFGCEKAAAEGRLLTQLVVPESYCQRYDDTLAQFRSADQKSPVGVTIEIDLEDNSRSSCH